MTHSLTNVHVIVPTGRVVLLPLNAKVCNVSLVCAEPLHMSLPPAWQRASNLPVLRPLHCVRDTYLRGE